MKKIGNGAIRHTTRHMWRVRMGWTTLLKRICLKHAARLMGFFSAHVIIKTPQIKADLAVLSSFAARGHICFVKMWPSNNFEFEKPALQQYVFQVDEPLSLTESNCLKQWFSTF